ncbi:MAG: hypothetical protein JO130_18825, partial [Solirubrobacterales bacterium]|nr:hypothetical protein [Solirubrobacterales bacterium]
MSEQTLDAPAIEVPSTPPEGERRGATRSDWGALAHRYRWVLTAIGLLIVSLGIVLYARARPGYDPYGWLVWGKLTIHLALDTNGAPSWKPLPYLFTVPYAVVGHYALWLWMVTSVAISLSGLIFAWRIAFRLTDSRPERRYASYVAGLCAAIFVFAMQDPVGNFNYTHYVLSAESDTMIVSFCLLAIDLHVSGRHKAAFWIWWLAALGRPEVWPFYGLAGLWLWRYVPTYRRWLYASLFLLAFLWFGIPGLSSKSILTAGNIAENSPRAIHGNKVTGTIDRFHELLPNPVWVAAVLAVAWAAWRRRIALLVLAAGALLWLIIEIAFALHGFPAVPRYMFEAGAVVGILAAVFIGRIVHELPAFLSHHTRRLGPAAGGPRLSWHVGTWGTVLVLVLVAGSMLGAAHRQYRLERVDLRQQRARTVLIGRLSGVVRTLGTSNMFACGQPNVPIGYQSVFAWYAGVKTGVLYVSRSYIAKHPHPLVNVYPTRGAGWKVFPSLVDPAHAAACKRMFLVY